MRVNTSDEQLKVTEMKNVMKNIMNHLEDIIPTLQSDNDIVDSDGLKRLK